jgi:transcriptional regulator with XRE-family HTH domain
MIIGERLRALREEKKFSQGDIEKRTGLLRCYLSRVENGHTIPSVETLEKICCALEIPLYQLFYEGEDIPTPPQPTRKAPAWGASGKEARLLRQFYTLLRRTGESDRQLLLHLATTRIFLKSLSAQPSSGEVYVATKVRCKLYAPSPNKILICHQPICTISAN